MEKFFYGVIFTLGVQAFGVFILYKIMECFGRYHLGKLGEDIGKHIFKQGKKAFTEIISKKEEKKKDE